MSDSPVVLRRDIEALEKERFDVLIVGAGIFGACAAWDAALRGLRVALIEKGDFCEGVSANSFKMIHGGIRYMQHLDVVRVRSSCHERSALLRIAPHLVHPLPIVIPTYGHGASGKAFLATGMYLYDLLTTDRNSRIRDQDRHVPLTSLLSAAEVKDLFPGIPARGLTGAARFSDAQMYNPPRLVLAFLQSAAGIGASVANYVRAEALTLSGDTVTGVEACDVLNGERVSIRARTVLLATGPWTDDLLARDDSTRLAKPSVYSRDACFVVPRRFEHSQALAIMGRTHDPDAIMSRPARHLFVVPWRGHSLIGVWHKVVPAEPDSITVERSELSAFIDEINDAYPELALNIRDVTAWNWGLVPFGEKQEKERENLSYGKRSLLIDHERTHAIKNLVSLIGIRYTMGRGDAARAMRMIARKLGAAPRSPATDRMPLYGGDFRSFRELVRDLEDTAPDLDRETLECLAHNHGTRARALLASYPVEVREALPGSRTIKAEVLNAIDNEMALTLADIVLRRTDLGTGMLPSPKSLEECAGLAAARFGWSPAEVKRQLDELQAVYPRFSDVGVEPEEREETLLPPAAMTSANSSS